MQAGKHEHSVAPFPVIPMTLFTHCVEFWREPRVALFNDVPGLPRFLIPNNPEDEKRNEIKLAGSSCQFDANTFH